MSKGWVTLKEWQTAIEIQLNQPNQSISGLVDVSSPDWSLRLYFSTVANQVRLNGCPLHTVKPDILRVKAMIAECRKCWWEVLMRSADEKCWWEVLMRSADEKCWSGVLMRSDATRWSFKLFLASWDVIEVLQFVAAAQEMLLTRLKMSFLAVVQVYEPLLLLGKDRCKKAQDVSKRQELVSLCAPINIINPIMHERLQFFTN